MKAFALILILIIALAADAITGFSSTVAQLGDVQQFQQGISQCSIVAPSFECSAIVTFPSAFVSTPNHIDLTWRGWDNVQSHAERNFPFVNIYFESDNGQTWTNMPAALTEIYGTTTHETQFNPNYNNQVPPGNTGSFQLSITCLNGSNSPTAVLRVQWADTGLPPTWADFANSPGAGDLALGGQCPAGLGFPLTVTGPLVGINTNFKTLGTGQLRIVGLNGGGVGDVPQFNNIVMTFWMVSLQQGVLCVFTTSNLCGDQTAAGPSSTQFRFLVLTSSAPVGTNIAFVDWSARLCIKGGSAC